ncbi:hypothetical protein CFC21_004532 [Triticum aestivum]|uniref:Uncharacterized protein n=1 Tax=Triticum aestivum TaxID=4565 RepID=A0A3B5Y8P9_WHEAT|nr:uncharacterized protein LOC123183337 [Triticum aestivum]KAF6986813.1 hypothetical protein CFC21_004532 [Triticum aestivum]
MAAVRCAARRLGGSLLQRTQAEERRRLVPSRLMRSRHLSTEQAQEIQQKKEAFYDAVSNVELKMEFNDALVKAVDPTGQKHLSALSAPWTGYERVKMYGLRALGVIELTSKTAVFVVFALSFVTLSSMKTGELTSGETTTEVKAAN